MQTSNSVTQAPSEVIIPVSLTEYRIEAPEQVPAGPVVLQITNNGFKQHGFEIAGNGEYGAVNGTLEPCMTAQLKMVLRSGIYRLYSPIGCDAAEGMERQLVVGEPPTPG